MIQFSKPKKTLAAALDPFRQRETAASEYLGKTGPGAATGSNRFDPAFYRQDPGSSVPLDSLSPAPQAVQHMSTNSYPRAKAAYGGYASSVISQQGPDSASVAGQSNIGYSQYDRLGDPPSQMPRRRLSIGSLAPSDAPTASMYGFGYKVGDDDIRSVATSQAGVTDF
jgi:regulator of nonsense transcripts 1